MGSDIGMGREVKWGWVVARDISLMSEFMTGLLGWVVHV